ncbi:MAG: hypothetical protein IPI52_00420 [Bacteroidetes bacterium]|nr:hypothetical protein [Bacteroidota bacterium]
MLLWNWLIPVIFGLKAITYFQALGLFLLSRILLVVLDLAIKNHLCQSKNKRKDDEYDRRRATTI